MFNCWVTEIHAMCPHNKRVSTQLLRTALFRSQVSQEPTRFNNKYMDFYEEIFVSCSFIVHTEQEVVGCVIV